MYNRYIPQSDGSYRKNRMPEQQQRSPTPAPAPQQTNTPPPCNQGASVGSFLKNLLPKDFDTGDLLVVLLLLLMAEQKGEDEKNNALLTLALYFFM